MQNERIERRREAIINILYVAIVFIIAFLCVRYVLKWLMPFVVGFIILPQEFLLCRSEPRDQKECCGGETEEDQRFLR